MSGQWTGCCWQRKHDSSSMKCVTAMESELIEHSTLLYQKAGFSLDEYCEEAYPGKHTEHCLGPIRSWRNVQHVNVYVHICRVNWWTISPTPNLPSMAATLEGGNWSFSKTFNIDDSPWEWLNQPISEISNWKAELESLCWFFSHSILFSLNDMPIAQGNNEQRWHKACKHVFSLKGASQPHCYRSSGHFLQ